METIPVQGQEQIETLSNSPTLTIRGQSYFAALIGPRASAPGTALLVLYPESSWLEARWESAQVPLSLGAGALVLMAAATTWIAHRISGRIHRLENQVARIAEGDFQELVLDPGAPRDEVDDLSRSINRMCTQLRQMSQTIRQSERTQTLAQLAAGMAHQLRNALTGARLSIQLHLKRCEDARGRYQHVGGLAPAFTDRRAGSGPLDAQPARRAATYRVRSRSDCCTTSPCWFSPAVNMPGSLSWWTRNRRPPSSWPTSPAFAPLY